MLFIPFAFVPTDLERLPLKRTDIEKGWREYTEKVKGKLADMGIDIVSPLDFPNQSPTEILRQVEGVFVGGGNTPTLLDELQRQGWVNPIKKAVNEKGMPYMGSSAGSVVAGPNIKTTNDMWATVPKSGDSFGLVPFNINAHFVSGDAHHVDIETGELGPSHSETRDVRIQEVMAKHGLSAVWGLREGGGVLIKGDEVSLVGRRPVRVFHQEDLIGLKAKITEKKDPHREVKASNDLSALYNQYQAQAAGKAVP